MAAPLNNNIREKILEGTARLLENASFSSITLGQIAREAGISKGTLYYYYSNKDDILFEIADRYLSALSDSLLEWTENPHKDTSLGRLLNYAFTRGIFDKSGNLRLYLLGEAVSGGGEELREKLLAKYLYFKNTLAEKIRQRKPGADADYAAWLVLTVMDGLLVQSRLQNAGLDMEGFLQKTVELMKNL